MLDRRGLAKNHLSSLSPVYQSHSNRVGTWKTDFDFWGERKNRIYNDNDGSGNAEVDFQAQTPYDDDYDACSPRLWKISSPLLPYNHHYSYPSPKSRLQAIIDGRRELMEMIQDMPESSYELSLKDIVDEHHISQVDEKDSESKEKSLKLKPEVKTQQKKKNFKRGQISRSQSMDSGVFLLKMFFPVSLGVKRKSTSSNHSKVSSRPSLEGSEKTIDKEWWKVRFLAIGGSKNSRRSSTTASTSSSSRSSSSRSSKSSRHDDINFTPSCWSFNKKYRSSRQRECLP